MMVVVLAGNGGQKLFRVSIFPTVTIDDRFTCVYVYEN